MPVNINTHLRMAQVLSSRGKLGKSLKYWCFWMMELKGNLLY